MPRHFIISVSFLALFASPSFAGPPRDRYQQALDLLNQADAELTMARLLSANPDDMYAVAASQSLQDAITATENAIAGSGGDVKKSADVGATDALSAAILAYYLHLNEPNADAAAGYLDASNSAHQAALLLNKTVNKNWPY